MEKGPRRGPTKKSNTYVGPHRVSYSLTRRNDRDKSHIVSAQLPILKQIRFNLNIDTVQFTL